jgi:hypothetical protein
MLQDLQTRTGLAIHRVEFIKIDFLKDIARINAFYFSDKNESASRGMNEDSDD